MNFDQLKTMLKSMSNAIFKRMGVLEDKVSPPNKPIKHIYATDEKGNAKWTKAAEAIGQIDPIIITSVTDGDESYYRCNFTADELWDIDANVIQQNTRVVDGDKEYAVRGVNKEINHLYGKIIQFTADLHAAYYDFTPPFTSMVLTLINYMGKKMLVDYTQTPRKKIDTGYAPYQRSDHGYFLGNTGDQWSQRCVIGVKGKTPHLEVSTVLNVVSSDYTSLTGEHTRDENPTYSLDIDRVSVVQAIKDGSLSGVVLYYTDSHEAAVGKTAVLDHIETTDITHTYADVAFIMQPDENGKYARITLNPGELKTANVEWLQTDTIGNKKVGDGLEVVDGKLRVKPEGKFKLVNTIEYAVENQTVVVDTTDDGRKWYFSQVFLEIQLNGNDMSSTKRIGVWGSPGFGEQICSYEVPIGKTGQKAQMRVYTESGIWNAELSPMSLNEIRPSTQFWRGFAINKTTERLPAITGVSGNAWPVGTILKIWGVWDNA